MKKSTSSFAIIFLIGSLAQALEKKPEHPTEESAMMQAMIEAGKPGAEHDILKTFIGDWSVDVTTHMGPNMPPTKSKAEVIYTSKFGGRFVEEDFKGSMPDGTKFRGHSFMGYDNLAKQYVGTWIDDMSTSITLSKGSYNQAEKSLTFFAPIIDPMTKEPKTMKMQITLKNEGEHDVRFWDVDKDGKASLTMEMTYKRK